MIDKRLLSKRFSEHAKTYDAYANVQKSMAKQLVELLPQKNSNQKINILEIGCGTGYLTRLLVKTFPNAAITAVDLAPGMVEVAKGMTKEVSVTFLCGDIEDMTLNGNYDLVISNATFQWLNNLPATLEKLLTRLTSGGTLIFSTFGNKTFQELHMSYEYAKEKLQLAIDSSPGQMFYTLDELSKVCEEAIPSLQAFPLEITKMEKLELEYFQTVREFFTSIKKIGAANSNKENYCQRPSLFRELIDIYDREYRNESGVKATYHCLFFKIKKHD
ncbi:Malonyl-[acyl-carrier protein] O-methyltransferase [Peribacillus sp. Bi96]|uniref:malonyl-ACP O-methyltransferase BioC n=1 Tax=unclassified Peribacillus TaxID=2675266 RepID=UPI001DF79FC8|nr:malonyl-ACP O-methyltransferase BioC [Peribacillus sp. Bi96]CAH0286973.1 Malonyl-[acyl-carrier protein] O-methyltransferase [Peribacillus sp. Bi96]